MRGKLIKLAVVVLTLTVTVAGVFLLRAYRFRPGSTAKQLAEEPWPEYLSLAWHARMAKAQGQSTYETGVIACGSSVPTLDYTLRNHTVVVAHLVEKSSYADNQNVTTWYRFHIDEALSVKKPSRYYQGAFAQLQVPTDLLPVRDDEFLLPRLGGVVDIGGVTVKLASNMPRFFDSKTYLLFLEFDAEKRAALIPWTDDIGIFEVDEWGTIKARDDNSDYNLKKKLKTQYGNSVDRLKTQLAAKTSIAAKR